jgi:peroxiredoxin
LRRWEELRPELDARGIRIVAICPDLPEEIRKGRRKHGLGAVMLSDRDLALTDRFGLRNRGFHSGIPGGAKALPVPTSILAGADGTVLWMDQSDNYQRRSDPDIVLAALRTHFGAGSAGAA